MEFTRAGLPRRPEADLPEFDHNGHAEPDPMPAGPDPELVRAAPVQPRRRDRRRRPPRHRPTSPNPMTVEDPMTNAIETPAPARPVDYGDLGWLLTSFARRVPTIVAALAVSVDGLAIASSDQVTTDPADQLAAITSGLASLTIGAAKLLSTGRVRQTVVDMDGGVLLIMSVADRAFLAVLAEPGADLGQVGYETAVLAQRVASALEPARPAPDRDQHTIRRLAPPPAGCCSARTASIHGGERQAAADPTAISHADLGVLGRVHDDLAGHDVAPSRSSPGPASARPGARTRRCTCRRTRRARPRRPAPRVPRGPRRRPGAPSPRRSHPAGPTDRRRVRRLAAPRGTARRAATTIVAVGRALTNSAYRHEGHRWWAASRGARHHSAGRTTSRPSLLAGALRVRSVRCGQRGDEGLLRHLDPADHLHPLLALLLLLQQLALAGDVTAVALREHVLADRPDRLAGDDPRADRRLDRHLELLPRDQRAQLGGDG